MISQPSTPVGILLGTSQDTRATCAITMIPIDVAFLVRVAMRAVGLSKIPSTCSLSDISSLAVYLVRDSFQVIRIHTGCRTAEMIDLVAFLYRAINGLIAPAVSSYECPLEIECPIPILADGALPQPTLPTFVNFAPKTFLGRYSRGRYSAVSAYFTSARIIQSLRAIWDWGTRHGSAANRAWFTQ